jgi:hypothetical protein
MLMRKQGVIWLRALLKPTTPRLALLALVLTVAAIFLSIYIDNHYGRWLSTHPITANMFAGLLGLPAAFLIVNLAAERALRWGEMSKWAWLRQDERMDFIEAWRTVKHDLFTATHCGIEKKN